MRKCQATKRTVDLKLDYKNEKVLGNKKNEFVHLGNNIKTYV